MTNERTDEWTDEWTTLSLELLSQLKIAEAFEAETSGRLFDYLSKCKCVLSDDAYWWWMTDFTLEFSYNGRIKIFSKSNGKSLMLLNILLTVLEDYLECIKVAKLQ